MPRWNRQERKCLQILRQRLQPHLTSSTSSSSSSSIFYPDILGDRKLIRYLRGHDYNIDRVYHLILKFLSWRQHHHVDSIRQAILQGDANHPLRFPKGEIILKHIHALVIDPTALDNYQSPLCVEQYNFSPKEIFDEITLDDYILYMIYTLEYRSLVLEQLSENREQEFLQSLSEEERRLHMLEDDDNDGNDTLPPYGVVVNMCVIRDLGGIGWEHLSSKGQEIIRVVVTMASDNYPELMRKCFMINTPWIFNTVWFFIKNLLAARTLAKISVLGTSFEKELSVDLPLHLLPTILGGPHVGYLAYVAFPFDLNFFFPERAKVIDGKTPHPLSVSPLSGVAGEGVDDVVTSSAVIPSEGEEETSRRKDEVEEQSYPMRGVPTLDGNNSDAALLPPSTAADSYLHVNLADEDNYTHVNDDDSYSEQEIDISLISLQTSGF